MTPHPLDPLSADEIRAGGRGPAARPRRRRALALRVDRAARAGQGRRDRRGERASRRLLEPRRRRGLQGAASSLDGRSRAVVGAPPDGIQPNMTVRRVARVRRGAAQRPARDRGARRRAASPTWTAVLIDVWALRRATSCPSSYARPARRLDRHLVPQPARLQPVREPGHRAALRRRPQPHGAARDRGHAPRRRAAARWASTSRASCPDLRLRDDIKPLEITQPEGVSFTLDGNALTLAEVVAAARLQPPRGPGPAHASAYDGARRVAHRLSFAEMVVPYRDPTPDHYRRTAFDIGEWGLGLHDRLARARLRLPRRDRATSTPSCTTPRRAVHDHATPSASTRRTTAILWKHVDRAERRRGPPLAPARGLLPRDGRQLRVPRLLAAVPGRQRSSARCARPGSWSRRTSPRASSRRTARSSTSAPTRRSTSTSSSRASTSTSTARPTRST